MIKIPAYLTGFSSKADGSAGLRFTTQELDDDTFLEIKRHHNLYGHLLFKENPFQASDIPTESAEDKNKTPSKRLRAALFVLWRQEGEKGDFEAYYRTKMEKLIDMVKAKLD